MKFLIGVDGSAGALAAVHHVLFLQRNGLRVELLLAVVQEPTLLIELMMAPDTTVLERLTGAVGHRALAAAETLCRNANATFESEIGSGVPAATIVAMASRHRCTVIVLGARGLGVLHAAWLGSVSQQVLAIATQPVIIVNTCAS